MATDGDDGASETGGASTSTGMDETDPACEVVTPVTVSGDWDEATHDFVLTGKGFDAYDGETISFGFTSGVLCGTATAVVACGGFSFSARDSIEDTVYKGLILFVDEDGVAGCTSGDPTWTFTTSPVLDDIAVDVTPSGWTLCSGDSCTGPTGGSDVCVPAC